MRPFAWLLALVAMGWTPHAGAGRHPVPPVPPAPGWTTIVDARYGFSISLPRGWTATAADGQPQEASAGLVLAGGGQSLAIRVCAGTGLQPCPTGPRGSALGVTEDHNWGLNGVPAALYRLRIGQSLVEDHLVAVRGGNTYDIAWTAALGDAGIPGGDAGVLCSWTWTSAPAR